MRPNDAPGESEATPRGPPQEVEEQRAGSGRRRRRARRFQCAGDPMLLWGVLVEDAMALSAKDWEVVMRTPLFKAMGPTIARAMIDDRTPRSYARGEPIFGQGDPADGFFCMIEGWAKLYRLREDGEEIVVSIFSAVETFAEVAMFLGGRYPVSCEAASPARILKIDAAKLREAVLDQPQLAFDMLAAASVRLRQLVDEIEQLKAKSAPQRIASFFLKQTVSTSGPARIALPYEKALIASRLGMKPESFSRALGKLGELGVVVERESVSISDVARLAAFAEGAARNAIRTP